MHVYLPLAVRVFVAVTTRTFFQPDEYFQALEPAHNIVFGYGHLTWEWLNLQPIRSIIYPALNIPIYWILKVSGAHEVPAVGPYLVVMGPRLLHGTFAAATDIWLCKLTHWVLGERYVDAALLVSLTSFFNSLSLSRSLSNSLETSLTTMAFAYYPWDASIRLSPQLIYHKPRMRKMLVCVALACSIRATSAVIWIFLFGNLFWALRKSPKTLRSVLLDTTVTGIIALFSICLIDSVYYGKPTVTPFSFVLTNLSGVSLFYGSNPWHYYMTQALPILGTTSLPFILHGIYLGWTGQATAPKTMIRVVMWTISVYSLAGHKEWRFIHPILPLLHLLAARSLVDLSTSKKQSTTRGRTLPVRPLYRAVLLLSLPVSIFVTWVYCSAPINVMAYIRNLPATELGDSVGFLMPCHSTPGHAYLHRPELANGRMWALGCEPPLRVDAQTYRDQTNIFFAAPHKYLKDHFPRKVDPKFPVSPLPATVPGTVALGQPWKHEWPRHLVFFGALLEQEGVVRLLETRGYREVWKRGFSWEGDGDERKGGVRVWKWSNDSRISH